MLYVLNDTSLEVNNYFLESFRLFRGFFTFELKIMHFLLMIKPYFKVRVTGFMLSDYVLNNTSLESLFHVLFVGTKIVIIKTTFVVKSAEKLLCHGGTS